MKAWGSLTLSQKWWIVGSLKIINSPKSHRMIMPIHRSLMIALYDKYPQWCDSLIARLIGPTWDPPGDDRTQVSPMLAPSTLLSGLVVLWSVKGIWSKLRMLWKTMTSWHGHANRIMYSFVPWNHRWLGDSHHKWSVTESSDCYYFIAVNMD